MKNKMFRYTFKNGDVITSRLSLDEVVKRSNRLDTLRVMMEGYDEGSEGRAIHNKAYMAYSKINDFTGIIRLTSIEKGFLSYKLESDFITEEEIEVIRFYCKYTEEEWKEILEQNPHLENR